MAGENQKSKFGAGKALLLGCIGFFILGGALIIGLISLLGSEGSSSNNSNTANNSSSSNQNEVYGLNQPAQDGDLVFTVTNVKTANTLGGEFFKETAQGKFYVLTLKIENKGSETATFDSSMAKIIDSENREFSHSVGGQTANIASKNSLDLFLQQIQPSLSVTGEIVFDLPTNVKDPVLFAKSSFFGFSKGVKIKLN